MIEWLIGASLLILVATHAYLAYSCFTVKPLMADAKTDLHGLFADARIEIANDFSDLTKTATAGVELVDELVQVLADATPSQSPPGSIMEVFLNGLMNKTAITSDYGSTQTERTIQEIDPNPQVETEN